MKNELIPYGKHYIDQSDIDAVVDVLKHKSLTQGEGVYSFERAVAKFVGAKYAVAMSSWTAGLHMACLAVNLKRDNEVVTSPITFVASSNAVLYCNSIPIFSDINPHTVNLCPDELEKKLQSYPQIKAIIPVHYAGVPCNMEKIKKITQSYNVYIIEDAAHALGARYEDGSMVGSCKYSDMTGFSFHPVKSIAAGEGGMITTNNEEIYKKLLRLRSHGINKLDDNFINDNLARTRDIQNPWYYEMQELGYNYRITDFQCALGESQLKKLPNFIKRRKELVKNYDEAFANINAIDPIQENYRHHSSHHLYVLRIKFNEIKKSRAQFMNQLKERGVLSQVHYMPVTSHPYYQKLGYKTSDFPEASKFYDEALSIPLYYSLTDTEQERVIKAIKNIIKT
jgi:perosamine synthetase